MNRIACTATFVLVALAGCGEKKETPAGTTANDAAKHLDDSKKVADSAKKTLAKSEAVLDAGVAAAGLLKAKTEWGAQIGDVPFTADWKAAMAQAKAAKKPLMIFFTDKKTAEAAKMGGAAFKDARVVEAAKAFVPTIVDADADAAFAERYNVRGVPTIVYADDKGDAAGTTIGASTADEVLRDMKGALDTLKEDAAEGK
jgi:hypothetical protein